MFDLRYHVASLAAVFLALIIGIVVGVGISDRGLVDSTKTKLLEGRVANLQQQLNTTAKQTASQTRETQAERAFVNETYPVLVHNRLRNKQVAVLFVGSVDPGIQSSVNRALADAGAEQLRVRALKLPLDLKRVNAALASQPAAAGFTGKNRLEDLGHMLGEELVSGGDTPLWNSLADALVEYRTGGTKERADGVVVVRTAQPQRGATSRFLLGLYTGLTTGGVPAVGAETTDAANSATAIYRRGGLSSVDDVDRPMGRLALVLLLAGAPSGQYGVKDSASNGAMPAWPTPGG